MNIQLKPESIRLETPVGENSLKAVVEGTLTLPAGLPPVQRVIRVAAVPRLSHCYAGDQEVSLEGTLDVTLLYAAAAPGDGSWREEDEGGPESDFFDDEGELTFDEELYRVLWRREIPFHGVVEVEGVDVHTEVMAHLEVEEIRAVAMGAGRSVEVDAVLAATVRALRPRSVLVPTFSGSRDDAGAQWEQQTFLLRHCQGRLRQEASVHGRVRLAEGAAVRRPLDVNVTPVVQAVAFHDGWVQVSGVLDVQLAYSPGEGGSGAPVEFAAWEGALTFTHRFEGDDLRPDQKGSVAVRVLSVDAEVGDEGRSVELFADMELTLTVGGEQEVALLTGVTPPSGDRAVETRTEALTLQVVVGRGEQVRNVSGMVELPEGMPPIERLLAHEARAVADEVLVLGDRVSVTGHVDVSLLYVARAGGMEGQVQFAEWKGALPFEAEVAVPGAYPPMQAQVDVQVDEMDPDLLNREAVEWRGRVRVTALVEESRQVEAVVEAVVVEPEEPDPPTYTFVVVQPGDTLWKLSRRYRAPMEAIAALNPHLEDAGEALPVGTKVCLPRHRRQALVPLNGAGRRNGA